MSAANTVYHENYGEVTRAQLAAYRKFNVSPSDHDSLTDIYGADSAAIVAAVRRFSGSGMFQVFELWQATRPGW